MTSAAPPLAAPSTRADAALEHALGRKLQLRIFVPILVLQVLNSLDRVNVSFAALHMNADLGLSRAAYGLGVSIFFWGYILFQYPHAWLLKRIGFRAWVAGVTVVCGVIAAAMAFVSHTTPFYVLRFLLGMAEAGFAPGVISFIRTWVPARHRALTISLTMLSVPVSVVLGGPVSGWLMSHANPSGLAGWRWMFLAEAAPLVLMGVWAFFYFNDTPLQSTWLSEVEKARLVVELAEDRPANGAGSRGLGLGPVALVLFTLAWFAMMSGSFSLIYWLPQVVKSFGRLSDVAIGVVSALPWAALGLGMVVNSRRSDRLGERFWHVVAPLAAAGLLMGLSGVVHLAALGLVLLVLGAGALGASQGAFWAGPSALLRRDAGVAALVVISMAGNLGGLVSPPVIGLVRDRTGSFQAPVILLAAVLIVGALALLPLRRALQTHA